MDFIRLRKDLKILTNLKKQGVIRDVDWRIDGIYDFLSIFGAGKLPPEKFNLPDFNIKLPIPANLYDPKGDRKFYFYRTIFIDAKLRRRVGTKWVPIARQLPNMNKREAGKGWAFLCVYPHDVREDTDIRALLPLVQRWILEGR